MYIGMIGKCIKKLSSHASVSLLSISFNTTVHQAKSSTGNQRASVFDQLTVSNSSMRPPGCRVNEREDLSRRPNDLLTFLFKTSISLSTCLDQTSRQCKTCCCWPARNQRVKLDSAVQLR
jgi:hypothetical protein